MTVVQIHPLWGTDKPGCDDYGELVDIKWPGSCGNSPRPGHGGLSSMSVAESKRYARHATAHRGLSYRERADGSKTFHGLVDGRRVRLDATGLRDAVAEFGELRGKVAKGVRLPPANARFSQAAEGWYESTEHLRPWTRIQYRATLDNELLPRFGKRRLREIQLDDVLAFIRSLSARELSRSTIENYLLPLSGTFKHAMRSGLTHNNPCTLLDKRRDIPESKAPTAPHEWSDVEIASLLQASEQIARKPEARYDYTPLLRVAIGTGLRLGELLGLQWGDIDFDEAILNVRRQYSRTGELAPPKTPKALRRVPLAPDLVSLLRHRRISSRFSQEHDFVFANSKGRPLQHRNVQRRAFEAARDLAGLPKTVRFHDLRHAFASIAAHRGVPVAVLSTVMGHRDVGVTQGVYTHLYNRDAAEDAFRTAMAGGVS